MGVTGKSRWRGYMYPRICSLYLCIRNWHTHTQTTKCLELCLHVCFIKYFSTIWKLEKINLFGWLITNSLIRDMQMMYTQILKHIFKQNDEYKYQYLNYNRVAFMKIVTRLDFPSLFEYGYDLQDLHFMRGLRNKWKAQIFSLLVPWFLCSRGRSVCLCMCAHACVNTQEKAFMRMSWGMQVALGQNWCSPIWSLVNLMDSHQPLFLSPGLELI